MSVILPEVSVYHLARLTGRFVCSKKVVEDFLDVHFSCVMVEGRVRVVDSNMNGFSSFSANLFAVVVYYLELGYVGSEVVYWKCGVCSLHWRHDYCVLLLYFPNVLDNRPRLRHDSKQVKG